VAKYSDFGPIERYITETVQDSYLAPLNREYFFVKFSEILQFSRLFSQCISIFIVDYYKEGFC